MNYLTAEEIAKNWGILSRRVRTLCNEGRVQGAVIKGSIWLIPDNADKPVEYHSGRKFSSPLKE